jgi:hypothetical protein
MVCRRALVGLVIGLAACGGGPAPAPTPPANHVASAPATAPTAEAEPIAEAESAPELPGLDAPTHTPAEAIARMAQFRDAMCTCTEPTCVDKLTDSMTSWGRAMAQEPSTPISEADTRQMAAITKELSTCMAAAMTARGSSTGTKP